MSLSSLLFSYRERGNDMAVSYANRGEAFETLIIRTNAIYDQKGWAQIEKAHPEIKITKELGNRIEGFKKAKGFVDFYGVCHGRAIAFEAKNTISRTSFPLKNIKQHQIDTLKKWRDQGAYSFCLIQFEKQFEVYLITIEQLAVWWDESLKGGRKSIPYSWFRMHCDQATTSRGVFVDYLKCLNLP